MTIESLEVDMIAWAKASALMAHESVGQTRKYGNAHYGKERYYFHPCRVAELVATVASNKHVIAAAALHDVLEDVSVKSEVFTPEWLLSSFGEDVLYMVVECSNFYTKDADQRCVLLRAIDVLMPPFRSRHDFPRIGQIEDLRKAAIEAFKVADRSNREQRKNYEAVRYGTISAGAQIIKRADLFDNALSMENAPADFVKKWMAEKALAESFIGSWLDFEKSLREAGELSHA